MVGLWVIITASVLKTKNIFKLNLFQGWWKSKRPMTSRRNWTKWSGCWRTLSTCPARYVLQVTTVSPWSCDQLPVIWCELCFVNFQSIPLKRFSVQYSRSEVMLTFFERSPLDQVLRNDKVHRIQPCFQNPIKISGQYTYSGSYLFVPTQSLGSAATATWCHLECQTNDVMLYCVLFLFLEIMRSNGFCLANTETIVFDDSIPEEKERPSSTDSVEHTSVLTMSNSH